MKWIVHLTVVLVNVLWVAFFLTDPLEVFVQKRSFSDSDEEMKVGEFCLQPPSDSMWTSTPGPADVSTDETRTTSDANRERMNTPNESHSVSRTSTEPNDLNSSQQSDIRAPTAAGQPPSTSSTVRDLDEATTFTPTVQTSTSSEATSVTSVISSSTSEAAADTEIWDESYEPITCCFSYLSSGIKKDDIVSYFMPDDQCSEHGVILVTKTSRNICADLSLSWVKDILNDLDETS